MSSFLFKMVTGVGFAAMSASAYFQLQQINSVLGTSLIDTAQRKFRQQRQAQFNETENKQIRLVSFRQKLSTELVSLEERLRVYSDRLIYYNRYKEVSSAFLRQVVNPLLKNYENQEIFQQQEAVRQLQESGNLNNQFTKALLEISEENSKIVSKNQGYLSDMVVWQDRLMTLTILGLDQNTKHKIDLLYNYHIAKLRSIQSTDKGRLKRKRESQEKIVNEQEKDYLDRLKYLA